MSATTRKQQPTSGRLTKSVIESRLKKARADRKRLVAEGKPLPSPTKKWSKQSFESLKVALGSKDSEKD